MLEPIAIGWHMVNASEQVMGGRTGTAFFEMLGVRAAIGRTFAPSDAGQRVAVLSDRLWKRHFAGDPGVVGRTVRLGGGEPYLVAGVLPPGFFFYLNGFEVWTPLKFSPWQLSNRSARNVLVAARLRPGISPAAAQSAMAAVARHAAERYPDTNRGWSAAVVPVSRQFTDILRPLLMALLASVSLLMMAGAVNVAGISLARLHARQKEMAIRMAMGAGRWRNLRLL
jgi:putative ABC transport system permease protein